MRDELKSKEQLISELVEARREIVTLQTGLYPQRDLITAQDLIWQLDAQGRIVYLNDAWRLHGGFDVTKMIGHRFSDFQPPEVIDRDEKIFEKNLTGGSIFGHATLLLSTTGEPVHLLINAMGTMDKDGYVQGAHGTAVDITQRVKLEEQLQESEQRYRRQWEELDLVYRTAPVGLCLIDTEHRFVHINELLASINGVPIEAHIGHTIRQILPDFNEVIDRAIDEVLVTGLSVENLLVVGRTPAHPEVERTFIGNYHPLKLKGGVVIGVNLVVEDITERVRSERALKESEGRLRSLINNSADLIWRIGIDGVITYISPSSRELLGFEPEELVGRQLGSDSEFGIRASALLDQRNRGERDNRSLVYEMTLPRKDGSSFVAEMRSTPVLDSEGKYTELQGTARDITERKLTEEQLSAVRRQNELILNAAGEGIYGLDTVGTATFVNPSAEKMLGFGARELIGKQIHSLIHHTKPDGSVYPADECLIYSGLASDGVIHVDSEVFWRADGTSFPVDYIRAPIVNEAGKITGVVVTFRDITERRMMANEMLKVQKLETIGILAGGIAHDLNNYLTAIMGNMSMARVSEERQERELYLDETERAFGSVRKLTHQLLTFAKGGTPVLKPGNIVNLIHDTTVFMLRGSNITQNINLPVDLWPVLIDEGQIHQVINNMIINAQQAMPDGGTLTITGENVFVGADSVLPLVPGRYIKISIEDVGVGMSEDQQRRIFDPFFTSKPTGSGLGLSTAYSIIHQHRGHIAVTSEEGKGSVFNVYLPVADKAPAASTSASRDISSPVGGKVLVMDDSHDIRRLCVRMLSKLGFEVVSCSNGEHAIKEYSKSIESGTPIDLVILDLTVAGGMGGKEALEKLRVIDPGVKAIVSSGYSDDPAMSSYLDHGFMGVLRKPYSISEISNAVSQVMNRN